jgi:hypothetical protein
MALRRPVDDSPDEWPFERGGRNVEIRTELSPRFSRKRQKLPMPIHKRSNRIGRQFARWSMFHRAGLKRIERVQL